MKKSDLYFTQRRTFIFSDVCLTHCSPRESHSSDWSQHLCALPKIAADSGRSLSCDTQLNCRTLFIKDDALLSSPCFRFLCGLFFNLPVRNKALCAKFTTSFRLKELTFERVPILTKWFSASAVYLSTPPSVTVDRYRLWTKPTVTKRRQIKKILMSSFPILVPPRCAWRGMPYTVLFWRNRLFNLFAWLVV